MPSSDATAPIRRRGLVRGSVLLLPLATAGVLLGFGWRQGELLRGFRLAGRLLLERAGVASTAWPLTATLLGVAHHIGLAALWGLVVALVARALQGRARGAAIALGAVAFGIAELVLPPALRVAFPLVDSIGRVVPLTLAALVAFGAAWWAAQREVVAAAS